MFSCVLEFVVHEGAEEDNASIAHSKLGLRGGMFSIRCLVFAKRNLFNYYSEREERRDIFLLKIE